MRYDPVLRHGDAGCPCRRCELDREQAELPRDLAQIAVATACSTLFVAIVLLVHYAPAIAAFVGGGWNG